MKQVIILILLCIPGMFYCLLLNGISQGEVGIGYDVPVITVNAMEEAIKEYGAPLDYFLWEECEKEEVKSLSIGITEQLSVMEGYGETSLFLPMEFLSGSILQKGDNKGCLIDKNTAFALFGTTNATGNTVMWKEDEYIVRGVIDTVEEFMLVENKDLLKSYSNVEIKFIERKENCSAAQLANNFLSENSLSGEGRVMDYGLIITWGRVLCLLPALLFSVHFILSRLHLPRLAGVMLGLGAIFSILLIFQIPLSIPDDFIPNQWSDFSFYEEKFKEITNHIRQGNYSRSMYKEIYISGVFGKSLVYGVICGGIMIIQRKNNLA